MERLDEYMKKDIFEYLPNTYKLKLALCDIGYMCQEIELLDNKYRIDFILSKLVPHGLVETIGNYSIAICCVHDCRYCMMVHGKKMCVSKVFDRLRAYCNTTVEEFLNYPTEVFCSVLSWDGVFQHNFSAYKRLY